jgi:hypothetical protein
VRERRRISIREAVSVLARERGDEVAELDPQVNGLGKSEFHAGTEVGHRLLDLCLREAAELGDR